GRAIVAEGHAEIDDDPAAVILGAVAIEVQVHADLAGPAEREEDEFIARCCGTGRGGAGGLGDTHILQLLHGRPKEHIPGGYEFQAAIGQAELEAAIGGEALEGTLDIAGREAHGYGTANALGALQPGLANGGEALHAAPDSQP